MSKLYDLLSSIVTAIKGIKSTMLTEQVQANWDQNDETQPDFVKGRTHYSLITPNYEETILEETAVTLEAYSGNNIRANSRAILPWADTAEIVSGEQYKVIFNGIEYMLKGILQIPITFLGNQYIYRAMPINNDTGEPFCIANGVLYMMNAANTTVNISVVHIYDKEDVYPIPDKYIPETAQRVGEDVILTSPDGTQYTLTADDDGNAVMNGENLAKAPDIPELVQSDWNQHNESAIDHVLNRPMYDSFEETTYASGTFTSSAIYSGDTNTKITDGIYVAKIGDSLALKSRVRVIFDGTDYGIMELVSRSGGIGAHYVGNESLLAENFWLSFGSSTATVGEDTGEPFCIVYDFPVMGMADSAVYLITDITQSTTHDLELSIISGELRQLDEKYIPDTIERTAIHVTMTQDESGLSVDKTYAELFAAYEAGTKMYATLNAVFNGVNTPLIAPLVTVNESYILFGCMCRGHDHLITINADDTIDYTAHKITLKTELLDLVYPLGSIYMSVNSASPADLFGGTWELMKDRFLLGAGGAYSPGAAGGEIKHTLTVDELPSHSHSVGISATDSADATVYPSHAAYGVTSTGDDESTAYWSASTIAAGGGQAHNNMPPYLAVYMWKRTA